MPKPVNYFRRLQETILYKEAECVYQTMDLLNVINKIRVAICGKGLKRLCQTDNVFLFVPNIIDYLRLVMILSFSYHAWLGEYRIAAICYAINFALDEVDGNSARYLGQTSCYGMLLDIMLDETSVLSLAMVLSTLYPQYTILFQLYSSIDFCGQWANYHFSAMYKNNKFNETEDWLISTYFNTYVLTLLWVYGNHIFLLMVYLCFYTCEPVVSLFGLSVGLFKLLAYLAAPWSVSRLMIMLYLLITSMRNIAIEDRNARINKRTVGSEERNARIRQQTSH